MPLDLAALRAQVEAANAARRERRLTKAEDPTLPPHLQRAKELSERYQKLSFEQKKPFMSGASDIDPTRPGHIYRGIDQGEHDYIAQHGHVLSDKRHCAPQEGTCFGYDWPTAESYTNYGYTNPGFSGTPTYVIEAEQREDTPFNSWGGYPTATQPIPTSRIRRVWRFRRRDQPEEGRWGAQGFESTAETVKSEGEPADLEKMQPAIAFPGLGVERRTDTPIVTTRAQHALRHRLSMTAAGRHAEVTGSHPATIVAQHRVKIGEEYGKLLRRRTALPPSIGQASITPGNRSGFVLDESLLPKDPKKTPAEYLHPMSSLATVEHEDFHHAVSRVADRYNVPRREVVKALHRKVAREHQDAAGHLTYRGLGLTPGHPQSSEEVVANLHNYLNNPAMRERIHTRMFRGSRPDLERSYSTRIKRAYHAYRQAAAAMLPSDLLGANPAAEKYATRPPPPPGADRAAEIDEAMAARKTEGVDKTEGVEQNDLVKATRPEDLATIATASKGSGGPELVDHAPHLTNLPPDVKPLADAYRQHVLESAKVVRKVSKKTVGDGITKKVVYETPTGKVMVKPYHERIIQRTKSWMNHPHQGWAEMANQALYHAAGIGDLHQKVHVAEHDTPTGKEPALVVHLAPGYLPAGERHQPALPEGQEAARKIGVMDFLTNNLDRHGGNLLVSHDGKRVLTIDHSRSFQYMRPSVARDAKVKDFTWGRRSAKLGLDTDPIGMYTGGLGMFRGGMQNPSAVAHVAPFPSFGGGQTTADVHASVYDAKMRHLENYAPIINEWWPQASPKVRAEMAKQLEQIKDPKVREHIQRNFDARADMLDGMARDNLENHGDDWYKQAAPHYLPGERTDEEIEREKWRAQQGAGG